MQGNIKLLQQEENNKEKGCLKKSSRNTSFYGLIKAAGFARRLDKCFWQVGFDKTVHSSQTVSVKSVFGDSIKVWSAVEVYFTTLSRLPPRMVVRAASTVSPETVSPRSLLTI